MPSNPFSDKSDRKSMMSDTTAVTMSPPKKSSSGHKKKLKPASAPLDVIDKLDVSSGRRGFHHDGPFDACNPHRNKKESKAPLNAFDGSGPNMNANAPVRKLSVGGTNAPDHRRLSTTSNSDVVVGGDPNSTSLLQKVTKDGSAVSLLPNFDSGSNAKPVHGDTTMGLGSSTFLDGAPAPKAAIERSRSRSVTNNV